MLVHHMLEDSSTRCPGAVALLDGPRTCTYQDLDRSANRVAHALRHAGVKRYDRVLIALDNSIEFVAAYLGTLKAGAVAVPLPSGRRNDRFPRVVRDCAPQAAVVDGATAGDAEAGRVLCTVSTVFVAGRAKSPFPLVPHARQLSDALSAASSTPLPARGVDLDLAVIIYTSGSTGEPRGVMLTHRNIVSNTRSIVSYLQLTGRDRVMCVLPFYYVYGLSLLHTHLAVGGSVVIDNRFVFPNLVLQAMQAHAVTGLAGVPSTFALLLHRSDLDDTPLPALRYVTQAGGGMPAAQIKEWLRRGPRVPFFVMYGATEASARLTYLDPRRLPDKLGSIGRAIPNVEVVVVREDGTHAEPGEIGELVARGSNIALGYWNNPEESAARFSRLGYHTGDLGYVDEEGFLFLVGRMHDMLKVGAHRVGPKEIEDVLSEHPTLVQSAVVGAPHPLLGEVPVAFVSMREQHHVSTEALQAFCRSRLPPHKVPVRFVPLADLPRLGATGKVDKAGLREAARRLTPADHTGGPGVDGAAGPPDRPC